MDTAFENFSFSRAQSFIVASEGVVAPPSPKEWVIRNSQDWTGPAPAPTPLTEEVLRKGTSETSNGFKEEYIKSKKKGGLRPSPLDDVSALKYKNSECVSPTSPTPDLPKKVGAEVTSTPSPKEWVIRSAWEWSGPAPAMRPLEDLDVLRATSCSEGFFKELAARCADEYEARADQLVKRNV